MHCSSGRAPQKLQLSPSSVNIGLLLAHVPANSPPFLPQILIAIPANANANSQIVIKANFISAVFKVQS